MDEKILDYMTKTEYASEYPGVVKNAEHADSATGSQFADNAIKLGGNESTYYASATAVTTLGTTVNGVLTTANTAQASANRAQETADSASIDAATAKVEAFTAKAIAEAAKEPAGCMKFFAGDVLPMGYLWCDGTSYPATGDYVKLYETVGTKYNLPGDVAGTFRVPDMRGRVCVGKKEKDKNFGAIGNIGGEETNDATHLHNLSSGFALIALQDGKINFCSTDTINYFDVNYGAVGGPMAGPVGGGVKLAGNTEISGSIAQNNLQPYLVCNYIIKY